MRKTLHEKPHEALGEKENLRLKTVLVVE